MINKLNADDLDFMESWYNPISFSECLFSNFDNPSAMDDLELGHIRLGQFSLLSYEYLVDEDPNLTKKQNFQLLEGAGTLFNFGARKYGKTLVTLILDMLQSLVIHRGWETIFTAYDADHILRVIEKVIQGFESHPILKEFKDTIKRSPSYFLKSKTGLVINGVNMNLLSKDPGNHFFGYHAQKLWMEEASKETDKVKKKRVDATSELGCIERRSGMTDFTKHSPAGEVFYDLSRRSQIVNYSQYINPFFDEKAEALATKEYGGQGSIGYRVFVLGNVVEDGISVFDIERVRENYNERRKLKLFEVSKETFDNFKYNLIVERPRNADTLYICADVGESAPTEIVIISETNRIYKYLYNITCYNLTDKQQAPLFQWLAEELRANFVGLDCTDGLGRAIFRSLEEVLPKGNLAWVAFNEKIAVDFEKDDSGNIVFVKGKPEHREEFVSEWSILHLKDLLYSHRMDIPMDHKFDTQINSVQSMRSGNRTVYSCISAEDHLFQAFQVWSIAEWMNAFNLVNPIKRKKFCKSGV